MDARSLGFGVIGYSKIAKRAAIPAIIHTDLAQLLVVGSRSVMGSTELEGREYPVSSYEEVLARADVDVVYVSLPNSLHEEWVLKALLAGKHVWCEKPAALSEESAKKMVALAKEKSLRLMEGYMFLYHPQHAVVKKIIESGEIGTIKSFSGSFVYPQPEEGNIRLNASLGGGVYWDAMGYPLRAARFIMGEPTGVSCKIMFDQTRGVDVGATMRLTFPNTEAVFTVGFSEEYQSTYRVEGTEGSIYMERAYAVQNDRVVRVYIEKTGRREEVVVEPADQFKNMIEEFCKEIQLAASSKKEYEDDLLAQARILSAGRLSYKENRSIELS